MRRILLLFMLVLLVFSNIANAEHYKIVVYPGPGNTTIVFTDTSSYEIQYDSNYDIILPSYGNIYEIRLSGVNTSYSDYGVFVYATNISEVPITQYSFRFVDEYGNEISYKLINAVTGEDLVFFKLNVFPSNGLTIYGFAPSNGNITGYDEKLVYSVTDATKCTMDLDNYYKYAFIEPWVYVNDSFTFVFEPDDAEVDEAYAMAYVQGPEGYEYVVGSLLSWTGNYFYGLIPLPPGQYRILKVGIKYHGTGVYGRVDAKIYDVNAFLVSGSAYMLGSFYGKNDTLDNYNGLYAIMGSRCKSWFGLGDGSSYPVRIVYDSGFTFWINSEQVGGGDIGYDNDYFLYRIYFDDSWHFIINDFYTGQYLSKDTGDTSVFSFNETYITEPYLFYIVFAPYKSDYVIIHIRAPPNYYVDNVTVQYMYAYYQNDNVYIWFEGNDAYIKLGYTNYYNAYYPLIVQFDLGVGDLPDRNTYDASRDPYSDNPPPTGSGSSGNNGNGGGGSFWGYQVPSSSFNGTLDIPGGSLFPQFLLNAMLFAAIFLPSVFLYRRYWLFPVLVGLLVLARIGYLFFYVPIVVFTIFVTMMFLREYIAEEYSLLVGLIMGYFMNVFIITGNQEYAPEPPSNPLEVPSYLNDLLTKAITFSYLPSPFNTIMTIFFVSLVVFAVIRLVVRIVRGV